MTDENIEMPAFTMKGLQLMMDRARLRHDIAQHDGDTEESAFCFGEIMALVQLASVYGWTVLEGVIYNQEDGEDG